MTSPFLLSPSSQRVIRASGGNRVIRRSPSTRTSETPGRVPSTRSRGLFCGGGVEGHVKAGNKAPLQGGEIAMGGKGGKSVSSPAHRIFLAGRAAEQSVCDAVSGRSGATHPGHDRPSLCGGRLPNTTNKAGEVRGSSADLLSSDPIARAAARMADGRQPICGGGVVKSCRSSSWQAWPVGSIPAHRIFSGKSFSGRTTVSKTVNEGSIPSFPAFDGDTSSCQCPRPNCAWCPSCPVCHRNVA